MTCSRMISGFIVNIIVILLINYVIGDEYKSSLTFVIDDTGSMSNDIAQVKIGTNDIFDTVLKHEASQIENFLLITFNDLDTRTYDEKPGVVKWANTKDRVVFKNALSSIRVHDGGDCPEYSMAGIKAGIEESLPNSYIYVFTDASAKDYLKYDEVRRLATKKQSQVVFVLTGDCRGESAADYQVYHQLANDTEGEVFNLNKNEVGLVLEYVKKTIEGRRDTLAKGKYSPGVHTFNFTAYPTNNDTVISIKTSKPLKPIVNITAPDGSEPSKHIIVDTDRNTVFGINVTVPGVHKVAIDTKSETVAVVTAKSEIDFRHGFSTSKPLKINHTSTRPAPDVKSHLSIKLIKGDVELKAAKIIDMSGNTILEAPLGISDEKAKLYVTELIDIPKSTFRIAIIGYDPKSKTNVTRLASTPIEPIDSLREKPENKAPLVNIEGDAKKIVEYSTSLQLICKVRGFPKPSIVWTNKDKGTVLSGEISLVDHPYDYVSILTIDKVHGNVTYKCEGSNPSGSDAKEVMVETKEPKRYFKITNTPKKINVEYQKEAKIYCLVDAYPPAEIIWYKNGRTLTPSDNLDISLNKSIVTIKHVKPSDKGKYLCEARNEDARKLFHKYVTVIGVEQPQIDKHAYEVSVKKGSTAVLECKILKGNPKPSINWFYGIAALSEESSPIEKWEDKEKIVIENAGKHDTGIYQCMAENEIGVDYHDMNLIVEYPPKIAEDAKLIKAIVGSELSISCNVDGGPSPYVTWFKDDVELTRSGEIQIFGNQTLKFAVKPSDGGFYTCKATNRLGTAVKTVEVNINVPVTIKPPKEGNLAVLVGSQLSLPCEAEGIPEPEIKWVYHSFNAAPLSKKTIESKPKQQLVLSHIQVAQEGYYTCIASNTAGAANFTYNVLVLAPPVIENTYIDKHFVAVEGDLVLRITCKASGNPKPSITWTKDGLNLAFGSTYYMEEGTLMISNVPKHASGVYMCAAENSIGLAQEIYEVSVDSYPKPGRPTSNMVIEESIPAKINCDVPHKIVDQLRWYKNGALIHTGELTLTNPSVRDAGHYTCRVGDFLKSVSGNVKVTVGFKPKFTTEEDENIEMEEGPPVNLICEASGVPMPDVSWYHNGKKLDSTTPMHYFPTGISSPGKYRCDVKNVFGTISRTFTATPRDCFVNIAKLTKLQPLMVTSRLTWPRFEKTKEYMIFPKGDQFALFCPNRFKKFPTKYITAFCDGGENIIVNGIQYDYSEIQCTEEVKHTVLKTGEQCFGKNTEKLNIGYKVIGDETVVVYQVCFDKINNVPLYALHPMQSSIAEDEYETTWADSKNFRMDFEEAYNCKNQTAIISTWMGNWFHNKDECCFSKRQLVNPRDVFPGVAQRSTYSYYNVVPHWGTCNDDNWNEIEQRVRNYAKNSYRDILVWTGTAMELSLPSVYNGTTTNFFTDRSSNRQPVPKFLWKVIQDPGSLSSLAIVQVNVPDLSPSEVYKYTLCRDVCDRTDWMMDPNWHDVTRGYTYCCTIQEFERAFGIKKVFSPDMNKMLTFDASVLPEYSLTIA